MLPFFKRFKQFFKVRVYAAGMRQCRLALTGRNIFSGGFVQGALVVVRLNIRKEV